MSENKYRAYDSEVPRHHHSESSLKPGSRRSSEYGGEKISRPRQSSFAGHTLAGSRRSSTIDQGGSRRASTVDPGGSRRSSMAGPGSRRGSAYESNSRRSSMAGGGSSRRSSAAGVKRDSVMFRDSNLATAMSVQSNSDTGSETDSEDDIIMDWKGRSMLFLYLFLIELCLSCHSMICTLRRLY